MNHRARVHTCLVATATALLSCVPGCLPLRGVAGLHERLSIADDEHTHEDLEPLARQIHRLDQQDYGDDAPQTLEDLLIIASMISRSGRPAQAIPEAEHALAEYQRVYGTGDYRTAASLKHLGQLLTDVDRPVEAERALDRAAEACRHAPDRATPDAHGQKHCNADFDWSLSLSYRDLGLYEKAEPFEIAHRTAPQILSGAQSQVGHLAMFGDFYFEYGSYPEALWYLRICKALWERVHPEPSAQPQPIYQSAGIKVILGNGAHAFYSVAPSCLENLIDASERAGDAEQSRELRQWEQRSWQRADTGAAERQLQRDIERALENNWTSEITVAYWYEALGFLHNKKQQYSEATDAFENAHRLQERNWALLSPPERNHHARARLDSLLLRGDNAAASGDVAKAEASYLAFVSLAHQHLPSRHRWRLEGAARLAALYAKTGRNDDALAMWTRYLDEAATSRGLDHLDYAWALAGQAGAYRALGRTAQAEQALRRAQAIRAARAPQLEAAHDLPLPDALRSNETLAKELAN